MDPLDPTNARTAIENIMFTYAERIDGGDFAGLAELFAQARMLGPDGSVQGEGSGADPGDLRPVDEGLRRRHAR